MPAGLLLAGAGCRGETEAERAVVTISGSAVGAEAELLDRQLARFMEEHPGMRGARWPTPDAADQRHQLYVQWLHAGTGRPDVLQLDVVWTAELAAAGWILPWEEEDVDGGVFFPATLQAHRWRGELYALPWFVDTGMLYWRTDLLDEAPESLDALVEGARSAMARGALPWGFVWQGARYEGLVTVFLEVLGAFGGRILDGQGRVTVHGQPGVRALSWLVDLVHVHGVSPREVLTWQEEQARLAFQAGRAALMRNWPYAMALLADPASPVAGRFDVAPFPGTAHGRPTAALGGQALAVNAASRRPEAARALVRFLLAPEQMRERAEALGQYPSRPALYEDGSLEGRLGAPPHAVRELIQRAVPRPASPVYTQLSGLLQVELHRALTRQKEPEEALAAAARSMEALLARTGLLRIQGDGGRDGDGQ